MDAEDIRGVLMCPWLEKNGFVARGVAVVGQQPFDDLSPSTWSAAVDESDEYSNEGGDVQAFPVAEDAAQSHHSMRQRRSIRKQAVVGGSAILECDIPYPPGVGGFASLASSISGPGSNDNSVMIKWHKQGIEVPIFIQLNRLPAHVDANYHGRIRLLDHASGSVEITGVRPKDEGWYECSVVFLQRTDETNPNGTWVYLAVTAPPALGSVSPAFAIQKEGATAEMFCESTGGIPAPSMTWLKDGRELQEQIASSLSSAASRISVQSARGRLMIRNVVSADSGVYTCLFKNSVGQVSHSIRLVVREADYVISTNAYILVPPKNMTAREGTRVRLVCQAEAHPGNISYQWYRDGVDVLHVTGLMSRAGVYADGSFIISSVLRDDTGWYRCQPTNGIGPPPSAEAFLNVTYLPRVVGHQHPGQIYLVRSLPGRLDCPADANPPVIRVVWTKDDRPIDEVSGGVGGSGSGGRHGGHFVGGVSGSNGGHVADQRNHYKGGGPQPQQQQQQGSATAASRIWVTKRGSLEFRALMTTDSGVYTCTPYSTLGKGQPSAPIHVFVKDAPYFVFPPRPIYQRHVGQSVTMPCVADGDPKPTVDWRKGDGASSVVSKALQYGGNLTIPNLTKSDQGSYECIASNVVTNVIVTTLLLIEVTTPHAPYNLSVKMSHRSAKISWRPAYDGGHPLHYVLWYKQHESGEPWQTLHVIPKVEPSTSMTIHNLLPETDYRFMVLSRNWLGDGMFSQQISGTTKAETTDPEEEEEGGSGEDEEELEEEEEGDGEGEGEEVDEEDYEEEDREETDDEEETATDDDDNYGGEEPVPVDSMMYTTPEYRGPKPDPPLYVTARLLAKDGGLEITWMPSPSSFRNKGPTSVTHFIIEYRTVGPWVPLGEPFPANSSVGVHSFVWKTASRGVTYQIRIRSSTEAAVIGEPSSVATVHTTDHVATGKTSGLRFMDYAIIGLIGVVVFVIIGVIVTVVFRLRHRRKRRAIRYDTVKYFGPNQVDTAQTIDRIPEGPICAIADNEPISMTHENHVTTLLPPPPHNNHEKKKIQETPI